MVTCAGHVLCCVTYLEKSTCARGCLFVRATFAWINKCTGFALAQSALDLVKTVLRV